MQQRDRLGPSVLIREVQPATDGAIAFELLAIQHAAYAMEARLIRDDRIPPLHETIEELGNVPLRWLGASIDDRVVGAVAWTEEVDELDIDRLMVAPPAQRAGVGSALIREVLRRAGVIRTTVSTGQANAPAKLLYEKLGFAQVGEYEVLPGLWVTRFVHHTGS